MQPAVKRIRQDPGCVMIHRLSLVEISAKERLLKYRCVRVTGQNVKPKRKERVSYQFYNVIPGNLFNSKLRAKAFSSNTEIYCRDGMFLICTFLSLVPS